MMNSRPEYCDTVLLCKPSAPPLDIGFARPCLQGTAQTDSEKPPGIY